MQAAYNGFSGLTFVSVHRSNQWDHHKWMCGTLMQLVSPQQNDPKCGYGTFGGTAWLMAVCWPEGPQSVQDSSGSSAYSTIQEDRTIGNLRIMGRRCDVIYTMLEIPFRLFEGVVELVRYGDTNSLDKPRAVRSQQRADPGARIAGFPGTSLQCIYHTSICSSTAPWDFMFLSISGIHV